MSGIIGTSHSKSKVIGRSQDTAKAWVNFDGTTNTGGLCTIRDSFNISSVTDDETGRYTCTFSSAMPNTNYCAVPGGLADNYSSGDVAPRMGPWLRTMNTANVQLQLATQISGGSVTDWPLLTCVVFGD